MPSNHLLLCNLLLILPSVFPSMRVFSSESVLQIRWPKYWSFSFSISPSMNIQGWFLLRLTGLISLLCKGLSRIFSLRAQKFTFGGLELLMTDILVYWYGSKRSISQWSPSSNCTRAWEMGSAAVSHPTVGLWRVSHSSHKTSRWWCHERSPSLQTDEDLAHLLWFPWPHTPLLNRLKTILVQLFKVLL